MILRKPYAFLIKNFKLIHLILTFLLGFVLYKSNELLEFFNQYLSSKKYEVVDNLTTDYLGINLYLVIFIVIGISAIIFWLMYKKDKPIKYYLFLIIYYIALIIGFIFIGIQLENISFNKIDVLMLNVSRDILQVLFLGQIPFLIISVIRTVGFDIKKFNFQRDLMDLKVDEKDNEEFELDIDIDADDVKTRFNRRKRLIGYVIKENKVFLITLSLIVIIIGGIFIYNTIYKNNRVYRENKTFTSNGISMTILDSYQFDKDLFGVDISKNKYSYTVVRVKTKNVSNEDRKLSLKTFTLKVGKNDIYSASTKDKDYFSALGTTGDSISLKQNEEKIFIIIFKINKEQIKSKKEMEYAGSYRKVGNERIYNIDRIRLNPKTYNDIKNIKRVKLGEKLTFTDSILKNTNITINEYEVKNRYTYSYRQCTSECHTYNDYIVPKVNTKYNVMVMRLNMDINIDKSLYNDKLKDSLIPSLGHIRYIINDKEYVQKFNIIDITPSIVNDYKYFEVKSDINKAEKVYLDFIILDRAYTYILRDE